MRQSPPAVLWLLGCFETLAFLPLLDPKRCIQLSEAARAFNALRTFSFVEFRSRTRRMADREPHTDFLPPR